MSKKHYEILAGVFAESLTARGLSSETRREVAYLVSVLAARLQADNARFDRARFLAACGVAE